jgi:hypothetical protein
MKGDIEITNEAVISKTMILKEMILIIGAGVQLLQNKVVENQDKDMEQIIDEIMDCRIG